MQAPPAIVWYRQDLRLDDHPALHAAINRGQPVIPLFIWSPEEEGAWAPGGASRVWLHHSLAALDASLRAIGSQLIIRRGPAQKELTAAISESKAASVLWCRRYEPATIDRDIAIKGALAAKGVHCESFNGSLLHEPWELKTGAGRPFQVYTPFWKSCLARPEPADPFPAPRGIASPAQWPKSISLDSLGLLPSIRWDRGIRESWTPGEAGAQARLSAFLKSGVSGYSDQRDIPGVDGTSSLSPHVHFGEISVRRVWQRTGSLQARATAPASRSAEKFLSEVGWREFAHHLLFHFPHTPQQPLRRQFEKFPWRRDSKALSAWQRGETGYPIVDAGMRQLWHSGWMHNRVRMIVGSFLVKHLLLPWHEGAKWFWDTLVDADLANNTLGWQWISGCGADAAPYFRIFNPVLQGEKFDADGAYVRRWVPELQPLPNEWVHKPWEAPSDVLRTAGITLGRMYPRPIVDHSQARARALEALRSVSSGDSAG